MEPKLRETIQPKISEVKFSVVKGYLVYLVVDKATSWLNVWAPK